MRRGVSVVELMLYLYDIQAIVKGIYHIYILHENNTETKEKHQLM